MAKYQINYGGIISGGSGCKKVSTPLQAVTEWCKAQKKYPTEVDISCLSKDSEELTNWCKSNVEKIKEIMAKTGADKVYRTDSLIDTVKNEMKKNPEKHDKYGGDQVYPFCQG